jgi:hypothetical protein
MGPGWAQTIVPVGNGDELLEKSQAQRDVDAFMKGRQI